MAYVVVLSTSQSCNSADTKWSPPTNVTPIRAAHHTPRGTLEYALYIRRNIIFRREKRVTYSKKSGASRRRKRGRELAEPHFVSLDLVRVHVLSDSYVQLHTKSRYIPLGVLWSANFGSSIVYSPKLDCESRFTSSTRIWIWTGIGTN